MRVNIEEKSYDGKRKILKNIKLDIPKHQTTLIIGTSGAGKSTLIKCLIHQTKFKGTIIDEEYDHKVGGVLMELEVKYEIAHENT